MVNIHCNPYVVVVVFVGLILCMLIITHPTYHSCYEFKTELDKGFVTDTNCEWFDTDSGCGYQCDNGTYNYCLKGE